MSIRGLMSINEAAERSGLSISMIRRYCQNGRLPASKVGRRFWIITEADFAEFMKTERKVGRPKIPTMGEAWGEFISDHVVFVNDESNDKKESE